MAKKGNRIPCAWVCEETGAHNYVSTYNKRKQDETEKDKRKKKYCPALRKHTMHKRKDVKS
jgi:ribosomal protein L33